MSLTKKEMEAVKKCQYFGNKWGVIGVKFIAAFGTLQPFGIDGWTNYLLTLAKEGKKILKRLDRKV